MCVVVIVLLFQTCDFKTAQTGRSGRFWFENFLVIVFIVIVVACALLRSWLWSWSLDADMGAKCLMGAKWSNAAGELHSPLWSGAIPYSIDHAVHTVREHAVRTFGLPCAQVTWTSCTLNPVSGSGWSTSFLCAQARSASCTANPVSGSNWTTCFSWLWSCVVAQAP